MTLAEKSLAALGIDPALAECRSDNLPTELYSKPDDELRIRLLSDSNKNKGYFETPIPKSTKPFAKKKRKKKRKKKKVRWDGGTKMIIQLFLSDLGYIHQYIPAYVSVQYTNYVRILIIDVESCPPEPLLSLMSIETTATES